MIAPQKTKQQGSSHADCGSDQRRLPTHCRALAGSVLLAMTVLSLGCGDVLFVPSPYTPQNVDLIYSPQEDISIVRWRISSTAALGDDLQFQILDDGGWQTIDFSRSVFPGGPSACDDGVGSCFQYVLRGQYPVDQRPRPVRAVHSTYGTLPGSAAVAVTTETLAADSWFQVNNGAVIVSLADLVAYQSPYHYPRSYDRTMWPTKGLCLSGLPPDGVSFSPLDTTYGQAPSLMFEFPPDLPLSASGIYCVGVRPIPADTGAAAVAQVRVATLPQLTDMQQVFTPPVEKSPVIYQIVFDLEIPVADHCLSSRQTIESLVDKYMGMAGVPVTKLPTKNIAVDTTGMDEAANCHQIDGRTLPAADMAQAVMQTVAGYPQAYQQFHFFYFNNLASTLPQTLTDSLQALFDGLTLTPPPAPCQQLRLINWLFNPGEARLLGNLQWSMPEAWMSADDPNLEQTLKLYAQQNLPYTSQIYDPSVPIPLLSAADAATYDGGLFKICASSTFVQPAYTSPVQTLDGASSWPIMASDPPGYLVNLATNMSAPVSSFVQQSVDVDIQLCSAYCDHGYNSTAGSLVSSWTTSAACAGLN
jgi:hypothetical protein